jgi:hypothetical protein
MRMSGKPDFLPNGRPPTEEDLVKVALCNPVVKACLAMYENKDLTHTQALIAAVLALVDLNWSLHNQVVEMSFKQRTVYIKQDQTYKCAACNMLMTFGQSTPMRAWCPNCQRLVDPVRVENLDLRQP